MKEISKAEFIRRVTENKTVFVGISTCGTEIPTVRQRLKEHSYAPRTCKAISNNHLVFDNDSHLYLADVKPHTFCKCYEDGNELVVEQKWLDIDWNGEVQDTVYKYLYYSVC